MKILGFLGRVSPEKHPEAVAKAVACLPAEWHGVLVGQGSDVSYVAKVRAEAEALAPGRVHFVGGADDIGSALAAFDVMLMPSHEEACSLAMIEAWLAGVPVVSTPLGMALECPQFVRGVPLNPTGEQIAEAILEDARALPEREARVAAAREYATANLTAACMAARWESYLHDLAGRKMRMPLGVPQRGG